jgi:hypothetical protein
VIHVEGLEYTYAGGEQPALRGLDFTVDDREVFGLLGLGYVLTGELVLPIGVHVAWNFFEGNLYGFPISGSMTSILAINQHGPDTVTGGAFGPEGGLLGVGAILLGILATVAWARYHQRNSGIHPAVTNRDAL